MESVSVQIQPFFAWLVRSTIQASVLVCLILLVQLLLRHKLGSRWCHALWLVLLLRMVLPWAPQSRASIFNLLPRSLPQIRTERAPAKVPDDTFKSDVPDEGTGQSKQVAATEPVPKEKTPLAEAPAVPQKAPSRLKPAFVDVAGILPLIWLAGAAVLGIYICVNNFALLRIVRRERPLTDQKILDLLEDCKAELGIRIVLGIVATDKVKSASLFGFVRPRLLLPAGMIETLSREELRYVFLHELAHLKRHDIYLGWLTSILQVLHWFNPLIWLAFYRMRVDRELACDALVLARTQASESKDYGRTIVSLLERFSCPKPLPAMAGILETKAQLKRRITMIARFKKNSYQWSPLAVVLIIILAFVSLPDAIGSKTLGISWPKSEPGISVRRIKTGPMSDLSSPLSLDGRYLCDVEFGGETRLVVRDLDTGQVRPLTEVSEGFPWSPVISPNSEQVAYVHQLLPLSPAKNELHLIKMDGTGHRVLHRFKEGEHFSIRMWTADGKQVLGPFWNGEQNTQLVAFSIEDGSMQVIHTFDTNWPRRCKLAVSPDGRYIAYDRPQTKGSSEGDISILEIESQQTERVVHHPAHDRLLGWTPDGNYIFFASNRKHGVPGGFSVTDTWDAYLLPVADGRRQGGPQLVKRDIPDKIRPKGFTRDGAYYYTVEFRTVEAVVAKLDLQTGRLLVKPQAVGQTGADQLPAWSPEGRHLAYCVHQLNDLQIIRIRNMATGQERQLDPNLPHFEWLRWAPDGKSLLVSHFDKKFPQAIYRIDASTGERVVMVQSESPDTSPRQPQLSLDGSTLYYVLRREDSQKASLIARNIESGDEEELFTLDGIGDTPALMRFALSPDGRQLALRIKKEASSGSAVVSRILTMPAKGGESRELWKTEEPIILIAWTPDGRSLLFTKRVPEGGRELWLIPVSGGQPRKLCSPQEMMPPGILFGSVFRALDVHPDGQRIAFDCFEYRHEVWAMENFLPEMPVATPEPTTTLRRVWAHAVDPRFTGAPSADGKYLSYVDWNTGDLAVHELASGKNRRLTNEGWDKGFALNSVFSPDSKQVAYYWWSNETNSGQLRIVGLDGSGSRVINQDNETAKLPTGWTPDGEHILALGRKEDKSLEISLVPVGDGPVRVLKSLRERLPGTPWRPPGFCLSPDGGYVAYTFPPGEESANGDISVLAVNGSRDIRLVEHPADDFVLGWAPDGKRVVFASNRTGNMGIWAVEVADGKPQGTPHLLKPEIGKFHPMGFTRNGSYYYGVFAGGSNVYTAAFDPQKGNVIGKPVLTIRHYEGSNWASDWSPDGRYLACLSVRPGVGRVFLIHSVETGKVRELWPDLKDFNVHSLRWSADGRFLLGAGKTKDVFWGVLKIDVETGAVTPVVEGPGIFGPNWSADGKVVFYLRRDTEGWRIIRRDLTTNEEKELFRATVSQPGVTVGGILGLTLSPDGKQLAFQDYDAGMLRILSVEGGQPRDLVKFKGKATIAWTPDGSHLVYANWLGKPPAELWRISVDGGEPQKLDLEMPYLNHVRFHPDGRRITFTSRAESKIEVWVMENFLPMDVASAAGK